MKELVAKLEQIQKTLNAPKNQKNTFGGYNYRSCEDILMAVKPLLDGAVIVVTDDLVVLGDRFYVKATASITDGGATISATAYARESAAKKGMDESQITGSASSYARKYALNGLLLIDDNKDADHSDNRDQGGASNAASQQRSQVRAANQGRPFDLNAALDWIGLSESPEEARERGKSVWERANKADHPKVTAAVEAVKQKFAQAA